MWPLVRIGDGDQERCRRAPSPWSGLWPRDSDGAFGTLRSPFGGVRRSAFAVRRSWKFRTPNVFRILGRTPTEWSPNTSLEHRVTAWIDGRKLQHDSELHTFKKLKAYSHEKISETQIFNLILYIIKFPLRLLGSSLDILTLNSYIINIIKGVLQSKMK
jgi:hypothetical protein